MEELKIRKILSRIVTDDDQTAFQELFDLFYTRLLSFANSIIKSDSLAEEIVLDVFTHVWQNRSQLNSIARPVSYLYVAVKNTSINYLERLDEQPKFSLENIDINTVVFDCSPEIEYISTELQENIHKVIETLPPKCKLIFKLIREDGLKYAQVAEILNISINTIDCQIAIALKRIGKALDVDPAVKPRKKK